MRDALFDIWQLRVEGSVFLDLFAGTGAVGLEAASRGAARVVLVELHPRASSRIRESIEKLAADNVSFSCASLPEGLREIPRPESGFDLVFIDPPYRFRAYGRVLAELLELLAENALVAVEHASTTSLDEIPRELTVLGTRQYGDQALTFLSRTSSS